MDKNEVKVVLARDDNNSNCYKSKTNWKGFDFATHSGVLSASSLSILSTKVMMPSNFAGLGKYVINQRCDNNKKS